MDRRNAKLQVKYKQNVQKANEIAIEKGIEGFKASNGWSTRFCKVQLNKNSQMFTLC